MANLQEVTSESRLGPFPGAELSRRWGLLAGLGALLLFCGILALGSTVVATLASVFALGIVLALSGLVEVAFAFTARGWQGIALHLLLGILALVAGVMMLRAPLMGASALTILMAAWLLVSGLGEAIHAVAERHHLWGVSAASGALAALLGVILLAQWPVSSLWFIGLYIGVRLVAEGISWMMLAFAVKNQSARMGPPMRPHLAT